jgi:Putative esterase
MRLRGKWAVALAAILVCGGAPARAQVHLPGLQAPTPIGTGKVVAERKVRPSRKRVDGRIADWRGQSSGYAGTTVYSRGELVYLDHLFDAYGPAAEPTVSLFGAFDDLAGVDPRLHRPTATLYEFGSDAESFHFGAPDLESAADLLSLRVATDRKRLQLLARTVVMRPSDRPALLVLLDTVAGSREVTVPFGSGLHSQVADVALLLGPGRVAVANLRGGGVTALPARDVAIGPQGYDNAIEAAVPLGAVGLTPGRSVRMAAATGLLADNGDLHFIPGAGNVAVANVAFRPDEPVEPAFDKQQALTLYGETIDGFFTTADLGRLARGDTERYEPGPGYHVRTLTVRDSVASEERNHGIFREYGVYLPAGYQRGRARPLVTFLHGTSFATGNSAHGYASLLPGFFRDFGDEAGAIVVFPNDRQPLTPKSKEGNPVGFGDWMGESLVELQTVWRDAAQTFAIDDDRHYLTGYSMGGYGAYELGALMPDRFAAVFPIAGQVSSGDYIGFDFAGCENLRVPEIPGVDPDTTQILRGDLCYPFGRPNRTVDPTYEGYGLRHPDPRATNMLKVAENLLSVPMVMYSALEDENQIYTNNLSAERALLRLGYRFRNYTFLVAEHETPGIFDEWSEAAAYATAFRRNPDPPRVRLARDMPLEREAELGTGQVANPTVHFDFDSAYWVSGLQPVDGRAGHASIDARSLAIPQPPHNPTLQAFGPATPTQADPFVMTGQAWTESGDPPPTSNGFEAALHGASAVTLAVDRMSIATGAPVRGRIVADHPVALRLLGTWPQRTVVRGAATAGAIRRGVLELTVPAGTTSLVISPAGARKKPRRR